MRALDVAELRLVLILCGILAAAGMGLGFFIVFRYHDATYASTRLVGTLGAGIGAGLGWLIGMAIVLIRRRR